MLLEAKDLTGPLVAALAVGVGIWQYRTNSQRDFIKPVREAQLKLYQEASSAAAQLATLRRDTAEWNKSRDEFLRLFYGPLAMVEDFDHGPDDRDKDLSVEMAMIIFKSCLDNRGDEGTLRDLSLALAHTCRRSLGESWGYTVQQLAGDYQRLARNYWNEHRADRQSSPPPGNDGGKQKA